MKKKTVHSKTKTTRHASLPKQTILFRRIVIISACLVLVSAVGVLLNKQKVEQSVAGASIMHGLYVQGTVTMPKVEGAVSYNIYYKQDKDMTFVNAVRNVPLSVATYTISHLKKGAEYEYRFAALDKTGKEFFFSPTYQLTTVVPM